ncbi:hypothetical protein QR680_013671 [Steinernema hermaphroditum]|uniref:Rap guanine nucleotide exchange factor 4 n=1 Tax=Steinernema hermaphroditum TaxID=289476 RepID=A0AA39I697_9BILA|nr:hypothetical protein QR680_013671 [Steinernema hermaphroditum]
MDHLVARIRRIGKLKNLSDALLLRILDSSDFHPDRVGNGVVLFRQGDATAFWYLLLSGEVELYLPYPQADWRLQGVGAGSLFGELYIPKHTCSARVTRPAEFVRISQSHFTAVYNKHADHLQPFITVMEDLTSEVTSQERGNPYDFAEFHDRCIAIADDMNNERIISVDEHGMPQMNGAVAPVAVNGANGGSWNAPHGVFELSNSLSFESRVTEAGIILKRTMLYRAPMMMKDRKCNQQIYPNCMVGSEMIDWLGQLSTEVLGGSTQPLSHFQLIGMWQTLLEHNVICHVTNEQQFKDKYVFYRWVIDDPLDDYFRRRATHPNMKPMPAGGFVNGFSAAKDVLPAEVLTNLPSEADLSSAIFFLSTVGPDSLFRMILRKTDRSAEELELVYEELLHIKALAHLSTMVKRELATVIGYEQHQHIGTVLFHQGDPGKSWYIILKGSVDVSIHGKGIVCTLHEGDDFGKLALVNDAPRAATIALREENTQFLVVDKHDFNRILRDVEANTVRLKEHGHDVLVLEKIHSTYPLSSEPQISSSVTPPRPQCCYSVMAGLPEKMVEYVLETRIDAQYDNDMLDTFLEDFILTHIIFMPSNILCNYLKNYYQRRYTSAVVKSIPMSAVESEVDFEQRITAKRRVVTFLDLWQRILGLHFFLDPVANSFIEEIYCCVLEDSKCLPNMVAILHHMTSIRELRENAKRILSRHPTVVLDCGVYSSQAPAPNPILPIDTCNQPVYISDTTYFTLSIRLDKTATNVADLARRKFRYDNNEECYLVEVKSSGEKVIFSPTEVSVPTMLGLNSKLYVAYKDEIDSLGTVADQNTTLEPLYTSTVEILSSHDIAYHLAMHHRQLFEATDEIELITQVIGRDQFPGRVPSNLDILMRRFNEVQFWTTTEILLAHNASKRLNLLKKFIKIAIHAKENKDLMTLFAVTLGLSNIAVSRLTHLWDKLGSKMRRQYAEFESLLDPSRNHRAYRMLVSKMSPPVIPFVPLLLKDLTFTHEGNKTYFTGLVNFEKMHMIANILRSFRNCKSKTVDTTIHPKKVYDTQTLIKNFRVIDNQRRLMELSYMIEPNRRAVGNR